MNKITGAKKGSFMLETFGCKTNRADSAKIAAFLAGEGWRPSGEPSLYIVNSCCVTGRSENRVLKRALALKKNHPASEIVLSGCVTDSLKAAAVAVGICVRSYPLNANAPSGFVMPGLSKRRGRAGRQRYFLKIQNGCDNFCAYCVVPLLRGPSVSAGAETILRELADLEASGECPSEIVLTGTNINQYHHLGYDLLDLIRAIRKKYSSRIRLGSLEMPFSGDFIRELSTVPDICPHFPVPLESGSDRVLKKMRRNYSVSGFMKILEEIRKYFDNPAITTDIIYGFPGESEDDFNKTLNVLAAAGFSKTHIFPFSPRPGTLAALDKPLPPPVMKERKARLSAASEKASEIYRRQFIGGELEVVAEVERGGWFYGTSGNYLKVRFVPDNTLSGDIVRVAVEGLSSGMMSGSVRETLWTATR